MLRGILVNAVAPAEVGALSAFLASADNGYVTGQSYVIDGGLSMAPRGIQPAS